MRGGHPRVSVLVPFRDSAAHIERCIGQWYAKHAIYGRSNQRNSRRTITCRPMSMAKRWRTYRAAVREHRLGLADSVLLFAVLTCGGISHEAGRLVGRLDATRAPS